jgi:antitoxin CptB
MTSTLDVSSQDSALLDERGLSKLRWRCRRGLLENDLFIDRFFSRYESCITVGQANAMDALMDLPDNDLLDLLLRRKEPEGELATAPVADLLTMMRVDPRPSFPNTKL